jgi:Flp pilus assembly protein TadB
MRSRRQGGSSVTHHLARLKRLPESYRPPLSYSDLTPEEQRLVQIGCACAGVLLWFAIALVDPWLLVIVPLVAVGCVWLVRRRRAGRVERGEVDVDDWSF